MKAVLLVAYDADLEIAEVGLADPNDHEVMVRIVATGICHSDLSGAKGVTGVPLPTVLGHEAAGIVEKMGVGVSKVRRGDRVMLSWAPACGHCFYCHDAYPTLCESRRPANAQGRRGTESTACRQRRTVSITMTALGCPAS